MSMNIFIRGDSTVMSKVGIVTIIDNNNYGNRLQNYALQETIKKLGNDVETIKNNRYFNTKVSLKTQVIYIKKYIQNKFNILFSGDEERKKRFKEFNSNINFSKKNISGYISKISMKYDFFVAGSDQIWKPTGLRLSDVTLLKFANNNQKISYAASFGVSEIPENVCQKRKKDFECFKAISVRENQGKDIVERMTGRKDIEVLIDPTMMLSIDEWNKVVKKPKEMDKLSGKKYILNYFLGELTKDKQKEIERVASENDCEIINILDKNDPFYKTGPSEFLYLEKNAFLICTDSFHSCVFAILFNRPFIVFERVGTNINMNSRIETLISKFEIENRKYKQTINKENFVCNYTRAYEILENERIKSIKFLKNNLK